MMTWSTICVWSRLDGSKIVSDGLVPAPGRNSRLRRRTAVGAAGAAEHCGPNVSRHLWQTLRPLGIPAVDFVVDHEPHKPRSRRNSMSRSVIASTRRGASLRRLRFRMPPGRTACDQKSG